MESKLRKSFSIGSWAGTNHDHVRTDSVPANALAGTAGEQTVLIYAQRPAAGRHQRIGDELTSHVSLGCLQSSIFTFQVLL